MPDWPRVKAGESQVRFAEAPNAPELLNCNWVLVPAGVAPPDAEIVMTLGELVAMVMLLPATREVVALVRPLIAVMPLPAFAGTQLVPLYVRTWFVVGVVVERAIPWSCVALMLPVPIAARVPEVFILTPLEVP